jgi:hypothetical protein
MSKQLTVVDDKADWAGTDLGAKSNWKYVLDEEEIQGLVAMAAKIASQLKTDPSHLLNLNRDDFQLGPFTDRIQDIYTELKEGTGIALIRGLPVSQLSKQEVATIYWGIGRHLGKAMPNNPEGDMLGHITDLGKTQSDANSRGYQTREAMDYHCDQCDIVGLICIRAAKSGGVSKVASSVSMYNKLVQDHPEYAQALSEPLYWTKHGEHEAGGKPFYTSPVFNFLDGKLCTSFGPKHIEKGHALPGITPLTDTQLAAIRTAENIADEQRIDMTLQVGDMQFLNNYVALHTRTAYVDFDDPAKKRLLWRLWLMNSDLRSRTNYSKQWQQGVQVGNEGARIVI